MKLGWIAVDGPEPLVDEALARLEFICDTYLSVSTPVQIAAPELIAGGAGPRAQILERVRAQLCDLASTVRGVPDRRCPARRRRLVGGAARGGDGQPKRR